MNPSQRPVFGRDVAFCLRSLLLGLLALWACGLAAQGTLPDSTGSLAAYPIGLYSSEMGIGGGGVVMLLRHPAAIPPALPPNSLLGQALYTSKGQFRGIVKPELQLRGGDYCLRADLDYKFWPDSFYGLGNHTRVSDKESFTSEGGEAEVMALRRLPGGWGVELSGHLRRWSLSDKEEGGQLQTADIPGGRGGGVTGLGLAVEYDTRDNTFSSSRGAYAQLRIRAYNDALGSNYDYVKYKLDARRFWSPATHMVLGTQVLAEGIDGHPPFVEMARTGGELRGIASLRYLGKSALIARGEYRWYPFSGKLTSRLGFAAFAAASQVTMHAQDYAWDGVTLTGGAGLRLLLLPEDRISIRLDYGISSDDHELEITATESF